MLAIFGYLSGLMAIIGYPPYIKDIFTGTTRPERSSFLIWSVLGIIAFASQRAEGATSSLWLTAGQTIGVIIIFIISLWRGEGGLIKRDIIGLILAAIGLLMWYFLNHAYYALFIVMAVDFVGTVLTIIKTYEKPESELGFSWFLDGLGGVFGCLAVGSFNPILLAYPFYIIVANWAVLLVIYLGKRKRP